MNVNLVESYREATDFLHWLGERRPILAIDTETGGLDWWRDDLRLVQFGDGETSYALPFHLWGGIALEAISDYVGPIVMHNAKFDTRYLEVNGAQFQAPAIEDTRIMAHLVDPSKPTHLKGLADDWLGANSSQWQADLKKAMTVNRWTWATVPTTLPAYWEYACVDTILTARLYAKLAPRLTGRLIEVYELEIAVQQIIDKMERKGVMLDRDYCRQQRHVLDLYIEQAEKYCVETYGFTTSKNASVVAQLQRDGVVLTKQTAGGNTWSVDESVLSQLTHPLAQLVLGVRKAGKYANAYFGNYLDMADGDLLHPDVNTLGARTGRMSISRPALQQIPRAALLRNAFVPREGNRLVSVDYDQIEMRLFTHYCQDAGLIKAFGRDGDFFLNAASYIYNTRIEDKKDPRRQLTKNASYAKIYGAGPRKFAITAGVTEPEARAFLGSYDAAFPGVSAFQKNLDSLAKQRLLDEGSAYVNTPLGRREPCEDGDTYKLVNYLVQGAAADVYKQALVELDKYGMTQYLVLPVHDEGVFDVPLRDSEEAGILIAGIMRREDFTVPLTTSAEVLERWGDKYD